MSGVPATAGGAPATAGPAPATAGGAPVPSLAEAVQEAAGPHAPGWDGSDRTAYRIALLELALADGRVWCLDSDMGGLEKSFQAALPDRYVDLGIAEANMMSVAAGLAATGVRPFVNTMAAFASARALEQVKTDIAYPGLPVRIVATHSGLSAGNLGPTHHAAQDLAALRTLPGMTVMTPADAEETVRMVRAAAELPGPVYIRLGRGPTEAVGGPAEFTVGRARRLREGGDVTLVAAGSLPVLLALRAARTLAAEGVRAAVLDLHTIKPLDVAALVEAARTGAGLVTVEDHSVLGGLGGAVAEALAAQAPARLVALGIPDAFATRPGGHQDQLTAAGVTAEAVHRAARAVVDGRPYDHSPHHPHHIPHRSIHEENVS
ncbi:transketolase family protein [Streptomyces sp. SPB074]|uniref:transketolase family protein n=1 Tax=Streptomyces sp. (strain SPB074) TaxID=465543 RepID=UPI000998B318|nr:transketolase C-terminal domain-containing protein [Streptomyces sp. SPB074]